MRLTQRWLNCLSHVHVCANKFRQIFQWGLEELNLATLPVQNLKCYKFYLFKFPYALQEGFMLNMQIHYAQEFSTVQ